MSVPTSESVASILLSIGAVSLSPHAPFTWASGMRSPVYCDNRLILGYPDKRVHVIQGFKQLMNEKKVSPDIIAGTATAGIPHAAWLAHEVQLPMVYVRSKPKEHGRKNQIEGPIEAGQTAVIVEDLISTGQSSLSAVRALVKEGVKVKAVIAIFSYGFDQAFEAFDSAGVPYYPLTTYSTLIEVAIREGMLDPEDNDTLQAWRAHPQSWSDSH